MLDLMYITNNTDIARIAENAGINRIFVDMEYIGKELRQGGVDSVKNHHTLSDCENIRKALTKAEMIVRINPIHEATKDYPSSEEEIEGAIFSGADRIILPYFKDVREVERYLKAVDGRVKTYPLVETKEAVESLDDILSLDGIDEIHIGLNDLSLSMGRKFMFEILADGTVDKIAEKINEKGIPFGFGGIASIGRGIVPAEYVIAQHYRLKSKITILSRSFCNVDHYDLETDLERISEVFNDGVKAIRKFERKCETFTEADFQINKVRLEKVVERYLNGLK